MSTATVTRPDQNQPTTSVDPNSRSRQGIRPIGFARLVKVELRKTIDTRAGLWMLITVAVIGLGAMAAFQIWGPSAEVTFWGLVGIASLPLVLLIPIIGTMAATSEWSQRTGLVTFALEPRRGRVVVAKLVAALILIVAIYAVTIAAAAAIHAIGGGGDWSFTWASVGGLLAALCLAVLQGSAFGFAFLNTPLAIVASLVLPTAWMILAGIFSSIDKIAAWLDLGRTTAPLMEGSMTGEQWAQLATSTGVWVLLPLAIGTYRVLTREVK